MKTNLTRNQLIALGTIGAVAVTGLSVTAYNASVHEQVCLSYERQYDAKLDKGISILQQANAGLSVIKSNPFAALGLLGQMSGLMSQAAQFKAETNNLTYAYVGTCGRDRFSRFIIAPSVVSKLATVNRLVDSLKSN